MATILQRPMSAGSSPFSSSPVLGPTSYTDFSIPALPYSHQTDKKQDFSHTGYEKSFESSVPSTAPSSPQYTYSLSSRGSYISTPSSTVSLDQHDEYEQDAEEDDLFPCFDKNQAPPHHHQHHEIVQEPESFIEDPPPPTQRNPFFSEDVHLPEKVSDDQAIEYEPTRHVDYLAHDWKEEDIWSSWRYIVNRRSKINNCVRLENASWRTWTKTKNHLKTVSPERLNWLKDCDVTWLYGPLQTDTKSSLSRDPSPPPSQISHSSSFLSKKPILKKKSASAAILERSRSQHSLLQRAGEIIRVQQSSPVPRRPGLRRGGSEFSIPSYSSNSVANTPAEQDGSIINTVRSSFLNSDEVTPSDSKHVLFNEEVRQVRAVDSEDDEKEHEPEFDESESDEDDDGGLIMAPSKSRSNKSTPRGSFSETNKTIMPLPSTTLKYRTDTPEPPEEVVPKTSFWPSNRKLSPSPSQETLRPSRPNHNFLLDDDPELQDEPWPSQTNSHPGYTIYSEDDDESLPQMRRTESGMFMPYDENEDEAAMNNTLFGQAMYAVNTFRDIAHVVWNVGWTRNR